MVRNVIDLSQRQVRDLRSPAGRGPRRYLLYGMSVECDLPLVVAAVDDGRTGLPDVVVRRVVGDQPPKPDGPQVASIHCHAHGTEMIEHRGPSGTWIWFASIGTFYIAADARRVDCYLDQDADEQEIGLAIAGPVLLFVGHRLGCPSLHASAIVTPHGAVGFLGARGRGKSSIAASFLRSGAALVADDALPLVVTDGDVYAVPGLPSMKVWSETARRGLALSDDLPNLSPRLDKKLLALQGRYPVAAKPVRLHTLYVLDRCPPATTGRTSVTIRALSAREAICTLLAYTSIREYLLPSDDAAVLSLYALLVSQARVRVLTYPDGFEHQVAVHGRILEDVEAC